MTSRKHVLWDWNGTLLDDAQLCCDIANELLLQFGKEKITSSQYKEVFGFPISHYYQRIGLPHQGTEFERASAYFIKTYEQRKHSAEVHTDAHDMLQTLRESGWDQSVLSAYEQNKLVDLVAHFELTDVLEHCLGTDNNHALGKIERGREFIAQHGGMADTWVLVGDTLHDAEVAHAMGIECCLVQHGHNSERVLRSAGVPVFETFDALSVHLFEQF